MKHCRQTLTHVLHEGVAHSAQRAPENTQRWAAWRDQSVQASQGGAGFATSRVTCSVKAFRTSAERLFCTSVVRVCKTRDTMPARSWLWAS
jgi:hypothetical protein